MVRHFLFAAAACAAFGIAIWDSSRTDRSEGGLDGPGGLLGARIAMEERAAAIAAQEEALAAESYARAERTRAGERASIDRVLGELLGPNAEPAAWVSLSGWDSAQKIASLARVGIRVELGGRKMLQSVVATPSPDERVSCADLARVARAAWGEPEPGERADTWIARGGGAFRAALRTRGHCELRIERRAAVDELAGGADPIVPLAMLGKPIANLRAQLAERLTAEPVVPDFDPAAEDFAWLERGVDGGIGPTRITARLRAGTIVALEVDAEVEDPTAERLAGVLSGDHGVPRREPDGSHRWTLPGGGALVLVHRAGRLGLTAVAR